VAEEVLVEVAEMNDSIRFTLAVGSLLSRHMFCMEFRPIHTGATITAVYIRHVLLDSIARI